ncbi:MAG: SDR family NAD(P)-dependent oxidoreductase [Planctomycetota bacterium]|jgi:NAD(P)-dependent dehydrogenase (short-subunit alcohol dehydrogenase family)
MRIDLAGEVALVTGASRGIGAAIARAVGEAGAATAVHFRKGRGEAEALAGGLPKAAVFEADLGRGEDVARLHAAVVEEFGPVTILVNNAGYWENSPAGDPGALERYRRMMAVNLDAAYHLCNLVVPAMKGRGGGAILNISSRAGKRGEPSAAQYAITKGGMHAMTVSLARELAADGIRVNCVAPGFIETERIAARLSSEPGLREALEGEVLLRRIGKPGDIAGAALFLVSRQAAYVTGQILHVNGGSYLNS